MGGLLLHANFFRHTPFPVGFLRKRIPKWYDDGCARGLGQAPNPFPDSALRQGN
ncbi:hypothetical protein HMPREF9440_00221 [Sutterella parvirubra YIT 11816]|uniref:Uncharacterized protein n=1 Tax=Sutterella parvirubra YIT 11816 TaxID=762967 RepID=H3KBX4_9BURK|nr:hypothetical protein HMPREF9440_00221 [Sutterella parvirubra YIT 11816]